MKKSLLFACVLTVAANAHSQQACTAGLQLPAGFCATVFAQGVTGARHIVIAPNGDVFINTQARGGGTGGGIVALRDTNSDGKSDVRQRFGSGGGTGIALNGNQLYATAGSSIVRYQLASGSLTATGKPDTIVTGIPTSGHHPGNFVLAGQTLYVNIGSGTNSCQQRDRQKGSPGLNPCNELNTRAGIWEFDANRLRQRVSDGRRFATGLRNSVALARNPLDGNLYAAVHGRDQLHDNWP
ncbi:MAG: PQQ-dependent sugar dehydrogenase, partial [Gemmatimonadaceae bacterium]